jgi:hypothetical protein
LSSASPCLHGPGTAAQLRTPYYCTTVPGHLCTLHPALCPLSWLIGLFCLIHTCAYCFRLLLCPFRSLQPPLHAQSGDGWSQSVAARAAVLIPAASGSGTDTTTLTRATKLRTTTTRCRTLPTLLCPTRPLRVSPPHTYTPSLPHSRVLKVICGKSKVYKGNKTDQHMDRLRLTDEYDSVEAGIFSV